MPERPDLGGTIRSPRDVCRSAPVQRHRGGTLADVLAVVRLSRPDAPAIAFLSYLVGVHLAGGSLSAVHVITAALLAVVSTNFIYAVNAVTDWREDAISHPRRPIPSGEVGRGTAVVYVVALFVASFVYPLLLPHPVRSLPLFWLLPLLGVAYSVMPVRLRRFPPAAVLVISAGLVTPITLAAVIEGRLAPLRALIVCLVMFCVSVVPLKAVEEEAEAVTLGLANLYVRHGRRLFVWAAAGMSATALAAVFSLSGHIRGFLVLACLSVLVMLAVHARRENPSGLYRAIIGMVLVEGVAYFVFLVVVAGRSGG